MAPQAQDSAGGELRGQGLCKEAGLLARIPPRFGPINILVNNAGGVPSELYDETGVVTLGSLVPWDEPAATWERILASNLTSVFLCTKWVHLLRDLHALRASHARIRAYSALCVA